MPPAPLPIFRETTDTARACPNCSSGDGLRVFYEVGGIPVQSNLLMPTRAQALRVPRGDLRLAFCPACGFITNTAFDPASQELSAKYEASQGFSATFNSFARSLAQRWAQTYSLTGKLALEIGCGKGEFIAMLCDIAACSGVGLDPTLDPARLPSGASERVRFIPDYFSPRYAHLPADFICCRHTLEHIPDTAGFVGMIRDVIGERAGVVVGFEVPDTLRVLREGAFWDLYYEHCSYFCEGSLASLFRDQQFRLLDLRREFDEQYLVLEARPAAATENPAAPGDGTAAVQMAVNDFRSICGAGIEKWSTLLRDSARTGRRVAVWGSGSKAVGFLTTLGIGHDVLPYVVDINPYKHNTFLPGGGQEIVGPERLREYQPQTVIAMNPIYRDEIARDLNKLGVTADLLTL